MQCQTYGDFSSHIISLPYDWYQIILLGDRGTCVWTACPRLLPSNREAMLWTHDLLNCKPTPHDKDGHRTNQQLYLVVNNTPEIKHNTTSDTKLMWNVIGVDFLVVAAVITTVRLAVGVCFTAYMTVQQSNCSPQTLPSVCNSHWVLACEQLAHLAKFGWNTDCYTRCVLLFLRYTQDTP